MTKFSSAQNRSSAPELRQDPLTGLQVIVAPERLERPGAFRAIAQAEDDPRACPFCPGNEAETPDPIRVYSLSGALLEVDATKSLEPWQVRVIPNRFPAVRMDAAMDHVDRSADARRNEHSARSAFSKELDLTLRMGAPSLGHHEVVVETPQHDASLKEVSSRDVACIWQAYRDRYLDWRQDQRLRCAMAFKNYGFDAGASLSHPHSQLMALDFVPDGLRQEIDRGAEFRHKSKHCLLCSLMRQACDSTRLVTHKNGFAAWCPYASGMPYETWIAPCEHGSHFEQVGETELHALAEIVTDLFRRFEKAIPTISFNLVLQSSPFDMSPNEDYHWHVRIIPRLVRKAGFEWYSGCQINPVPPEFAADTLKQA